MNKKMYIWGVTNNTTKHLVVFDEGKRNIRLEFEMAEEALNLFKALPDIEDSPWAGVRYMSPGHADENSSHNITDCTRRANHDYVALHTTREAKRLSTPKKETASERWEASKRFRDEWNFLFGDLGDDMSAADAYSKRIY